MNVGKLLSKAAATYPEKPALIHGPKRLTYAQFDARVNRLAGGLGRLGLVKGDNVAILQYNYPETLESLFACFKAGFGSVPINFRLHPKEFAYIIDHSEAKAVIVSPEFNESIVEIRDRLPKVRHFITILGANEYLMDYEKLIAMGSDRFDEVDTDPDDLAWLFYTSGTTGDPKGAMLTHRVLLRMTMNFYADILPLSPFDAILHAAPLSHGSGLYSLPNIGKGATNVIPENKSFDVELTFEAIERYRITNMWAAPTMIKLLVEGDACTRYDHSSLKGLIYGGGPMYAEDLKRALQKLGPCLVQLYGQGESPMTITYLPPWDHVPEGTPEQGTRLSSAGIQRTDVEVKIFGPEDTELPAGEVGEIVTRSDLVMKGYWRNREATAETLRNGWLHTGDVGYMDPKGYLFILDRSKDMIVSGGENIYPREIEEVLIRHPAVREAAVIGVPDDRWGESIKAIVALAPGANATENDLIAFCKDNIASYKKPKSVDFVDALPKNNYGKIVKRDLRARYWAGRDRKII
jgi:acyl-CoA synthetase (AMP-forming)/AMP-acid ligase II